MRVGIPIFSIKNAYTSLPSTFATRKQSPESSSSERRHVSRLGQSRILNLHVEIYSIAELISAGSVISPPLKLPLSSTWWLFHCWRRILGDSIHFERLFLGWDPKWKCPLFSGFRILLELILLILENQMTLTKRKPWFIIY